ncbi:MAG: hypothetical protein ACOX8F_11890 [Sakamotonia sp.]
MHRFNRYLKPLAVLAAAVLLAGCGRVTEEELAARENGIALLESGDHEGALDQFEALIQDTDRVTAFEVDVLKYRAEAEYGLEDYGAAAHTYDILSQIDEERAEYGYFAALCLAKAGDPDGAWERLEQGKALDPAGEAPGYTEAMTAVGGAYLDSGSHERADAVYAELIQSGKAGTAVYNRLALAEMKAADYETALGYCETGLALSDRTAVRELRFNQAVCLEYMGQYQKALELFQAYTEEFGSDEEAEHEIAFLKTR